MMYTNKAPHAHDPQRPLAVVVDPSPDGMAVVADVLSWMGFEVLGSCTHAGAAQLAQGRDPLLLVACMPAAYEDRNFAFLAEHRQADPDLATVVLVSDPDNDPQHAPPGAHVLLKPFSVSELIREVERAIDAPRPANGSVQALRS